MKNEIKPNQVIIDTGLLPCWPQAQAINLAYTESLVRLSNALDLDELAALPEFQYKFIVTDPVTLEKRIVVQAGSGLLEPTPLPFDIAISILTIIRLQNYNALYSERGVITCYFKGGGGKGRKSDMDRLLILFEERPEFSLYQLSNKGVIPDVTTEAEEAAVKKETNLPTTHEVEGKIKHSAKRFKQ